MPDRTPAEQAAEDLRELVREAHGLLKDLRAERRAIVDLLDGIPAKVDDRIQEHLKAGLEELGKATKQAMTVSIEKVSREFDRLEAIFLGTDRESRRAGKPSVEDLIRRARTEREDDRG